MAEFELYHNIKAIEKKVEQIRLDSIAKATSKSAQQAATYAAEVAAKSGLKALDDPIPAVFQKKKSKNRVGWIYFEWDSRADIKRGQGNTIAKLHLQGFGPQKAREEQQEAIHRQIFGTKETKGVTPAAPFIIRPSRRLLAGGSAGIKGVPLWKIDKFGNLRNYRKTMDKAMNDKDGRFFQVKLGESGGGKNNNGLKLKPGLYFRKLRVRRYKRNKHTKRKGGPLGANKTKQTVSITTVLTYHRIRDYKKKWNFREETQAAMRRRYKERFIVELNRAISKEKKIPPSGMVRVGRL